MPISMYQASTPVFLQGLATLKHLLDKAEAHGDPAALAQARLAPDMLTLVGQVQRASDTAKFAAARLTGVSAPKFADEETSFADLRDRIAKTVAFLREVPEAAFEGSETRAVTVGPADHQRHYTGQDYLLQFALPNFFFHVTTAYAILRNAGIPVGKRDYLFP